MESKIFFVAHMCQGRLTPYIGDSHPTLSDRDPGYINPYYWVHDHPLSYRNNGSLDPSTHVYFMVVSWEIFYIENIEPLRSFIAICYSNSFKMQVSIFSLPLSVNTIPCHIYFKLIFGVRKILDPKIYEHPFLPVYHPRTKVYFYHFVPIKKRGPEGPKLRPMFNYDIRGLKIPKLLYIRMVYIRYSIRTWTNQDFYRHWWFCLAIIVSPFTLNGPKNLKHTRSRPVRVRVVNALTRGWGWKKLLQLGRVEQRKRTWRKPESFLFVCFSHAYKHVFLDESGVI